MEIFADIEGYEGLYQVSNFGNVKSLVGRYGKGEQILKLGNERKGYKTVTLCKNGTRITKTVHRLVAVTFFGESNLHVNHKDGNKLNNHLVNLEYVTASENIKHAIENKLLIPNYEAIATTNRKPVLQIDKNGNVVNRFESAHDAAKRTGCNRGNISSCCRGSEKHKTVHGYRWEYESVGVDNLRE